MVMLSVKSSSDDEQLTDIFVAASNDDPEMLISALGSGQTLNDIDMFTGFTPVMIAVMSYSEKFLKAALERDYDPWIRDQNERLAIDHAAALQLPDIQKKLHLKMYPAGWASKPGPTSV